MLLKRYAATIGCAISVITFLKAGNLFFTYCFAILTVISIFKAKNQVQIDQFVDECHDDQYFNNLLDK